MRGALGHPPQRVPVDVHQAELLRVALGPLEVVHQAPGQVPAQVDPGGDGAPGRAQVAAIEALSEAGRRVPRDVAVIGFDDSVVAQSLDPR